MTLKIAVFAPIPSPSVISAASVNPGVRARRRSAYFKSRIESIIGPFLPLIPRPATSSARSRMQRIVRLRDRDRKGPYSPSLPHHRAYGSVHGGSDSYAFLRSDNLGSPIALK